MHVYVGSRTTKERNARGLGISVFRLDADQRSLELIQVVDGLINPSFLALNAAGTVLYTVHGDEQEISALDVGSDGHLRFRHSVHCGGRNPVHLAIDPTGRYVLVSNHLSGNVAVLPLAEDGSLGEVAQRIEMPGEIGPHRLEQKCAKPHFNPFDPSGRYVVVPDKGLNRVFSFRFVDGRLEPAAEPFAQTRETAGPRHIAFHPRRPFAYVANELDSTVTAYRFNGETGQLSPFQVLSGLPDTWTGDSRASEVEISADGSTLYVSNRGEDGIARFRVGQDDGRLQFVETTPCGGRTPRFFALTPNGKTLFCLNEDSDSIVGFDVQPDGSLRGSGFSLSTGSPVCMVFSNSTPER